MIRLDKRLQAVYDAILPCDTLADIGADHGKIAVKAMLDGKCKRCIAGDISEDSLTKARELACLEGVNVDFRVGNGVTVLHSGEYDTLVIAGMGGLEIIKILENAAPFKRYILVPHTKAAELRRYMRDGNICPIEDYKTLCNKRYYDIIVAEKGEYRPCERELYYGYGKGEDYYSFVEYERGRLTELIAKSGGDNAVKYRKLLKILETEQ